MSLADRFRTRLRVLGVPGDGDAVVVAVSGGLDSLVLLHLLRFEADLPGTTLVAAHLDHRMRQGSGADARWVRGLLRAWGVEGRIGRAEGIPESETEARGERYTFLEQVRRKAGAEHVLLAHHADDQAETVLFRVLRGTGIRGLGGIPERREPGIVRPLLPFWRSELEAYARSRGIRPRLDPSNRDPRHARNVIRHQLLPLAEERVAPGARKALVRLARIARREESAWDSLAPGLLEPVLLEGGEDDEDRFVLDRSGFLAYHPSVRARLLRRLARRLKIDLDETGTRQAVEFTSSSPSGGRIDLPGQGVLTREFDRFVLGRARERGPDEALLVPGPGSGSGEFAVGGRTMRARWAAGGDPSGTWIERFSPSSLLFPLRLRGWNPGDRIRFSYGSKKLKKIFGERRIPVRERHRWPVVVDARDRVVWIPGLVRAAVAETTPDDDEVFAIGITDVDGA